MNTIYRCSPPTNVLQNSYNAICTGVITQEFLDRNLWQELLHRSSYTGVLTQELTSGGIYAGVDFWEIYSYLNTYKNPTSQVLLSSLIRRQGSQAAGYKMSPSR
jgi:hypothetical protein